MSPKNEQMLALIMRSPDRGEGWRTVSAAVWPLVQDFPADLVELEPNENGGGRIRLNSDGHAVARHLGRQA
jgi:hypothetical protein